MKKMFFLVLSFVLATAVYAQKDVTKFLGIPVDGTKEEMIQKLKAKGFRSSPYDKEVLEGEFNGQTVNLHIVTNNNKVYRIMVCDNNTVSERDIKIRFNRLCEQFKNNQKYLSIGDYTIPDDEDISYEMIVHKKRYEASFFQAPDLTDTLALVERFAPIISSKFSDEELSRMTDEEVRNNLMSDPDVFKYVMTYVMDASVYKSVWFIISNYFGRYYITMFYDNEYNEANGEDL